MNKRKFDLIEIIGAMVLLVMLIFVSIQVISRYVFNNPFTWTEEMARFLLVWLTFIGSVIALKRNQHVKFEYILDKLPTKIKTVLVMLGDVIISLFFLIIIWYGFKLSIDTHSIPSVTLEFIRWSYVYAAIPVGLGLMLIFNLLKYRRSNKLSNHPPNTFSN